VELGPSIFEVEKIGISGFDSCSKIGPTFYEAERSGSRNNFSQKSCLLPYIWLILWSAGKICDGLKRTTPSGS